MTRSLLRLTLAILLGTAVMTATAVPAAWATPTATDSGAVLLKPKPAKADKEQAKQAAEERKTVAQAEKEWRKMCAAMGGCPTVAISYTLEKYTDFLCDAHFTVVNLNPGEAYTYSGDNGVGSRTWEVINEPLDSSTGTAFFTTYPTAVQTGDTIMVWVYDANGVEVASLIKFVICPR